MYTDNQDMDCAVCLQKCHHPTQLPCGHIFCFLCVKGITLQSKKCAMCRAEIPRDYLDHPVLLETVFTEQSSADVNGDNQWYYEGRNGWWKYDERSNSELEAAFNDNETECTLLIAGALYTIDFQNMMQVRHSDATRRRHVRRDVSTLPAKGIAGIKNLEQNKQEERTKSNSESENDSNEVAENQSPEVEIVEFVHDVIDLTHDHTDEVTSPPTQDIGDSLIQQFSTINLNESESTADNSTTEDT